MDHVLVTPIVDGVVKAFRRVLLEVVQLLLGVSLCLVHTQGEVVPAEGRFDDCRVVLSGNTDRATHIASNTS